MRSISCSSLIGIFALQDLNTILTMFRFTVIAEGLNATFLYMWLVGGELLSLWR